NEIRPPEGSRQSGDDRERRQRGTAVFAAQHDIEHLRSDDEHGVGMTRKGREQRDSPKREPTATPAFERVEQRDERERAREEEERVHTPVEPVKQKHPGTAGEK